MLYVHINRQPSGHNKRNALCCTSITLGTVITAVCVTMETPLPHKKCPYHVPLEPVSSNLDATRLHNRLHNLIGSPKQNPKQGPKHPTKLYISSKTTCRYIYKYSEYIRSPYNSIYWNSMTKLTHLQSGNGGIFLRDDAMKTLVLLRTRP